MERARASSKRRGLKKISGMARSAFRKIRAANARESDALGEPSFTVKVWYMDRRGYTRFIGETSEDSGSYSPTFSAEKRHFSAGDYVDLKTSQVQTAFSEGMTSRTTFSFYVPSDDVDAGEVLFELCHSGQVLSRARQAVRLAKQRM